MVVWLGGILAPFTGGEERGGIGSEEAVVQTVFRGHARSIEE